VFAKDALHRNESCGGHFREEYQSEDGEAQRDDENFAYVAGSTLVSQAKLFCTETHSCMKMLN
jgi:succinate dehydrogenase/fumarate reductase flavoprotein subunit